jgi:hypothetical protein
MMIELRNDLVNTLELRKKKMFAKALGAHEELGMASKVAKPSSHIVSRLLDGSPNGGCPRPPCVNKGK